jgi:flap endonuclease-1
MDSLTFGSPVLVRGMSSQKGSKANNDLVEIDLAKVLDSLKLTQEEFVDLCILCGCDYTGTISGIGPVKAYKFIQECGNIEKVLKQVEREIAH